MRSKRYGKRIAAVFLAVILTVTLYPPAKDVRAQEAGENHTGGINVTDNTESEPEGPEKDTGAPVMPDKAKKNKNAEDQDGSQSGNVQSSGNQNDGQSGDGQNGGNQGSGQGSGSQDGSQTGGGQGGGSQLQQMLIAMPVKMDEGEDIYKSLSQFLALSADQFEIYTVAFWSLSQNQAVMQAESALEVSVRFPEGYDPDRTVVSEVTLNGETPVRKELPGKCENGQMIFKTDHAGVYVIMEKKILPELPASLELTAKIDKLKLEKRTGSQSSSTAYAQTSSIRLTDRESGAYTSPQTGIDDSASMLGWGIAAAAAAAAVIVLVVVIFRRRK
ncbi:MAG TPA: hypothetical protein H9799_06630 [Candidatus Mediterraneibacter merdipullorum]|nr:hypothetical protein [Candidatus Mediterraneibacter merdipullorum]